MKRKFVQIDCFVTDFSRNHVIALDEYGEIWLLGPDKGGWVKVDYPFVEGVTTKDIWEKEEDE